MKKVVFAYGRFNPPTIGHEKLIHAVERQARGEDWLIIPTQSVDPKDNPLPYDVKTKYMKMMFPQYADHIDDKACCRTPVDVMKHLMMKGYSDVVFVVGSDRLGQFGFLEKNNRKDDYSFNSIEIVSAGERDPDAQGVTGISASKMRYYATKSDFTSFSQGLPKNVSNSDAKILYNMVRRGMGLKEEKLFKRHLQLESISNDRENYIRGNLFNEGDDVVIKNNDEVAKIIFCGSNYVIIETSDGLKLRKWLGDVSRIDEAPRYYGGVHRKREDIAKASAERLKQQTKRREALNKEAEMDIERAKKMRRKTADG